MEPTEASRHVPRMRTASAWLGIVFVLACTKETPTDLFGTGAEGTTSPQDGSGPAEGSSGGPDATSESSGSDGSDEGLLKLDLGLQPDIETDCVDPEDCECEVIPHEPCDSGDDPGHAMGLGCADEHPVTISTRAPQPGAIGTLSDFGDSGVFAPREGARFAVLGTGMVADLPMPPGPNTCNDAIDTDYTDDEPFPAPLVPLDVGPPGCADDPTLVGTGDCSNTIQEQYDQGFDHFDYAELRVEGTVPDDATSIEFDFAYFSYEYPVFFQRQFNDMFVAWLDSEWWTGNISFDADGNPISLNAGFLDFRDVPEGTENDPDCLDGCVAAELHGTCMEGHAGTQWLHTKAPAQQGEDFTLVFAIFDMSDPNLDSYVFLDDFRFGCEEGPPVTEPAG